MARIVSAIAGLLSAATLAGCGFQPIDAKADQLARRAYDQLRHGQDAALIAEMEPQFREQAKAQLADVRALAPPGDPTSGWLAGFNAYGGTGGSHLTLTHQYDYNGKIVTVATTLIKAGNKDGYLIRGFNLQLGMQKAPSFDGLIKTGTKA